MDLTYDSKIGRGAFADVWHAVDTLGRSVAVKFFNDTAPTLAEINAVNHAKALARVDHPAVVRVIALERQRHPESDVDCLAIIMEYVSGPSLSLYSGSLTPELALSVIRDLAGALEAIHSVGLVHGDLHDGNVLITSTGAKVVDILYTHSLAEVGTRTAARSRDEDLRDAAVLFRLVVEKSGQGGASLAEAYYRASTAALNISEMADMFAEVASPQFKGSPSGGPQRLPDAPRDPERRTNTAMDGDVPDVRTRASRLIARLQSRTELVAACVADALSLAIAVGDQDLKLECERELVGYGNAGKTPPGGVGPRRLPRTEDVEHRQIQFYVSLGAEVNIDFFGSGQRAIAWMQNNPKDFQRLSMLYPMPVAEVERDAKNSTADKLISIRMPASALVPNTTIPDAPVICYARGDAFADLLERIRVHLTSGLLKHAGAQSAASRGPQRDGVQADPSHLLLRIDDYVFQLRTGTAPAPSNIRFATPQAGRVAAAWDIYLGDTRVGWFSIYAKGKDGRFRVAEARTYVADLPGRAHADHVAVAWVSSTDVEEYLSAPAMALKFQRLTGVKVGDNYNDYLAFMADGTKLWVAMSGILARTLSGDHEAYYHERLGNIPDAVLRQIISESKEVRVADEYVFYPGLGTLQYPRLTFL